MLACMVLRLQLYQGLQRTIVWNKTNLVNERRWRPTRKFYLPLNGSDQKFQERHVKSLHSVNTKGPANNDRPVLRRATSSPTKPKVGFVHSKWQQATSFREHIKWIILAPNTSSGITKPLALEANNIYKSMITRAKYAKGGGFRATKCSQPIDLGKPQEVFGQLRP